MARPAARIKRRLVQVLESSPSVPLASATRRPSTRQPPAPGAQMYVPLPLPGVSRGNRPRVSVHETDPDPFTKSHARNRVHRKRPDRRLQRRVSRAHFPIRPVNESRDSGPRIRPSATLQIQACLGRSRQGLFTPFGGKGAFAQLAVRGGNPTLRKSLLLGEKQSKARRDLRTQGTGWHSSSPPRTPLNLLSFPARPAIPPGIRPATSWVGAVRCRLSLHIARRY
jgi:hypothetical protein